MGTTVLVNGSMRSGPVPDIVTRYSAKSVVGVLEESTAYTRMRPTQPRSSVKVFEQHDDPEPHVNVQVDAARYVAGLARVTRSYPELHWAFPTWLIAVQR